MRPVEEVFGDILATFFKVFRIPTIEGVCEHINCLSGGLLCKKNESGLEFGGPKMRPKTKVGVQDFQIAITRGLRLPNAKK